MNKTKLLAALLSLALVFSACGGAASSESNVAHNHATHTEVTTEDKEEVATELATEMVDSTCSTSATDATEMVDTETTETDATETVVAENEETKDKNDKTDAPNKDASKDNSSNKDTTTGSNNAGNTNTGSNGSGTNTGSNGSGASKPGSTEKDTEKPVTPEKPEKDTEKPAPDTEKPVESTECKHTGKTYLGIGTGDSHAVLCWDCDEEIRRESCDFTGGVCKCGLACNHMYGITEIVESTDKSGRCGWSCNACGFTSLLNHNVVWLGDCEGCTRCSTTWACTHGHGANIYAITDASGHLMACNLCQATIAEGPHTYANGACTVCGWAEPVPETEAPAPESTPTPEPEAPVTTEAPAPETPVVEDSVTSVEVSMVWKHVCRHH